METYLRQEKRIKKRNKVNIARDLILINAESRRTREGSLIERVDEIFFLVTIARSIPSRVPQILRKGKKGYVHCVISYPYRDITPVPCCVSAPENHRSEYLLRFIRHKITRHESFGFKGCLPDCIFFPSRRDRTSSLLMSVNSVVSDIVLTIHGVSF